MRGHTPLRPRSPLLRVHAVCRTRPRAEPLQAIVKTITGARTNARVRRPVQCWCTVPPPAPAAGRGGERDVRHHPVVLMEEHVAVEDELAHRVGPVIAEADDRDALLAAHAPGVGAELPAGRHAHGVEAVVARHRLAADGIDQEVGLVEVEGVPALARVLDPPHVRLPHHEALRDHAGVVGDVSMGYRTSGPVRSISNSMLSRTTDSGRAATSAWMIRASAGSPPRSRPAANGGRARRARAAPSPAPARRRRPPAAGSACRARAPAARSRWPPACSSRAGARAR